MLLGIMMVSVSAMAQPPELTGAQMVAKAREVLRQIENKSDHLTRQDLRDLFFYFGSAERVLATYPEKSPFRFTLNGTTLTVHCGDRKILEWRNHDKMEIRGDVIALLDSAKEFAAYRCDGTNLVKQWRDVTTYRLTSHYIGLLDTHGEFEAYDYRGKEIISNWKDVTRLLLTENYIALLDRNGIFEGYDARGRQVIRQERVARIEEVSSTTVRCVFHDGRTLEFPIYQP